MYVPGLTDREVCVWQSLANGTSLNVSAISLQTGLHRPAVYACLASLTSKGLVKTVTDKRRVTYAFTGTTALEQWRASQEQAFSSTLERVKTLVPPQGMDATVQSYQGAHVYRVWDEVTKDLPKGSIFYRYDGYAPGQIDGDAVPAGYRDALAKKKLERFVITNGRLRASVYQRRIECASRMLPASFDAFEAGITQFVTPEALAFVDFQNQRAYVIKNAAVAKHHVKLFQYLYSILAE